MKQSTENRVYYVGVQALTRFTLLIYIYFLYTE